MQLLRIKARKELVHEKRISHQFKKRVYRHARTI